MLRILTALIVLAPGGTLAQDAAESDVLLRVKPVLCVTDNRNPSCDLSFLVMWESATSGYYCLFNDFDERPQRCWSEERMGELIDDRSVTESFSFWMTGEDLDEKLAEVGVEVLRLASDDRRRRRRTRHVWDIH